MKYFTLSYNLTAEDYTEYDKIYNRDSVKLRLRRMLPLYVVPIIICFFLDVQTAIIIATMAVISFILPYIGNKEFSKCRADSSIFRRATTVEFYDNHIVTRLLPYGNFKSETEKHYGFDKIQRILESETTVYFAFSDNTLLLIPKKYINEEQYTMIKNLIENLFRNKYFYLQTKN